MQFATVLHQYHNCDEITWKPLYESLKVSHRIFQVICANKSSSPEEEIEIYKKSVRLNEYIQFGSLNFVPIFMLQVMLARNNSRK